MASRLTDKLADGDLLAEVALRVPQVFPVGLALADPEELADQSHGHQEEHSGDPEHAFSPNLVSVDADDGK